MTTTTEPLPPTVTDLLAHAPDIRAKYPNHLARQWRRSQLQPPFLSRLFRNHNSQDTSSASFYRIYQFFVLHDNIKFRNELEYFCCSHPSWSIASLPDPADTSDPVRYAILAVLTQLLCESFNRRIALGLPRDAPAIIQDFDELQARPKVYEEPPEWAKRVRENRLEEKVFIPNAEGVKLDEDDEEVCKELKDLGIIIEMPHIHFI